MADVDQFRSRMESKDIEINEEFGVEEHEEKTNESLMKLNSLWMLVTKYVTGELEEENELKPYTPRYTQRKNSIDSQV